MPSSPTAPGGPRTATQTPSPLERATTVSEGVSVAVRVRPISTNERADPRVRNCIQCLPKLIVIDSNSRALTSSHTRERVPASQPTRAGMRSYQFSVDHTFHTHASQFEVYEQSCKRIVEGVFHGINGSILAYGATGSGKTHTMFGGTMSAAGIVYQAVQDIFAEKERLEEEEGKRVRIQCSFVEVYNEDVFDLLARPEGGGGGGGNGNTYNSSSSSPCANGMTARQARRAPLQVREVSSAVTTTTSAAATALDLDEAHPINGSSSSACATSSGGLHIQGLTYIFPETLEEFARGVEHGHAQRFMAVTKANAQSSRSHAIITIEVQVRDNTSSTAGAGSEASEEEEEEDEASGLSSRLDGGESNDLPSAGRAAVRKKGMLPAASPTAARRRHKMPTASVTVARIQFADLAGSERAASTSNTGIRLREGGKINQSLLALGAVVQGLAQQNVQRRQTGGRGGGKLFIPYRGSKLTRLLRDSIGGNCRTLMLFCLSPSTRHIEESVNTMKFAMNAKEIQVEAYRNEFALNSKRLAKTQEALIEELRGELARARSALAAYTDGTVGHEPVSSDSIDEDHSPRPERFLKPPETSSARTSSPLAASARRTSSPCIRRPSPRGGTRQRSSSSPIPTPHTTSGPRRRGRSTHRDTLTPSMAASQATALPSPSLHRTRSPNSVGVLDALAGDLSQPRLSVSGRTPRASVFTERLPPFSELEAKLKDFGAKKESLYHAVRDAQERQRDGEMQLREKQWRLAAFLISNASGNRARGETNDSYPDAIGVAGLRKMIAGMEADQVEQDAQLKDLTARLDDAEMQFAATRQDLLHERQGNALELLLENARLRQGCMEAECLAAHYHQECRSLSQRNEEYADALAKCASALQMLRPHFVELHAFHASQNGSHGVAVPVAIETADVALLYAVLPSAPTKLRMSVFESALRRRRGALESESPPSPSALHLSRSSSPSTSPPFAYPPLAPHPINRGGRYRNSSPLRGGRMVTTSASDDLAEHFRDLMATAESMRMTGITERHPGEEGDSVLPTRHGHYVSAHRTGGGSSNGSSSGGHYDGDRDGSDIGDDRDDRGSSKVDEHGHEENRKNHPCSSSSSDGNSSAGVDHSDAHHSRDRCDSPNKPHENSSPLPLAPATPPPPLLPDNSEEVYEHAHHSPGKEEAGNKAFGRTVSLTGLTKRGGAMTTTTTTVSGKKRAGLAAKALAVGASRSGKTKKAGEANSTTPALSNDFCRSLSAPLSHRREALGGVGAEGRALNGGGHTNGATAALLPMNGVTEPPKSGTSQSTPTGHMPSPKSSSNGGTRRLKTAVVVPSSLSTFVRSSNASELRAQASINSNESQSGWSTGHRAPHLTPTTPPRCSSEGMSQNGGSHDTRSSSGTAKKKFGSTPGNKIIHFGFSPSWPNTGRDGRGGEGKDSKRRTRAKDTVHRQVTNVPSSRLRQRFVQRNGKRVPVPANTATTATNTAAEATTAASADQLPRALDFEDAIMVRAETLSRISSSSDNSSSLNVSCDSTPLRYRSGSDARRVVGAAAATTVERSSATTKTTSDAPGGTLQLTVARLQECAAAPAPSHFGAFSPPFAFSGGYLNKDGSGLRQSRARTPFTDDLMVSRSTCMSDVLSLTSPGPRSSTCH